MFALLLYKATANVSNVNLLWKVKGDTAEENKTTGQPFCGVRLTLGTRTDSFLLPFCY